MPIEAVVSHLHSGLDGLTTQEAAARLKTTGPNLLSTKKPPAWWQLLLGILPNPFNILLAIIAIISVATRPPNWSTFIILVVMIVISCAVRFWQEYRSNVAAIKLQSGVPIDVRVRRQIDAVGGFKPCDITINEKDVVPGDIVLLSPGNSVPADCLVLQSSNLQISQSR